MTYPRQLEVDPSTLSPNPWNTNIVSPENEAKLDASLKELGVFKPVIVRELADGSLQILGGEHRAGAAKRLGMATVPVFNLGPIEDRKAKLVGLADNSRYGVDDTLSLAELLKELGTSNELQDILPWTDTDLRAIFASCDIALEALEDSEIDADSEEILEPTRAPKTHTIMRFKVPLGDAERIAGVVERTKKRLGLTESDELTNAGDALVALLLTGEPAEAA